MITIRIGRRGQITLPSQLRKKIGLQEGNQVAVISQGDLIILRPITHTLLELRGSVPVEGKQPFEDIRHQVIQSHAGEVAQIDG